MKSKRQTNIHHIVSQCMKWEYNTDKKENKLELSVVRHAALHTLFGCLHTPKEQLKELYCIYESILSDTAKELFSELMRLNDYDFYIDWLKKWTKKQRV